MLKFGNVGISRLWKQQLATPFGAKCALLQSALKQLVQERFVLVNPSSVACKCKMMSVIKKQTDTVTIWVQITVEKETSMKTLHDIDNY